MQLSLAALAAQLPDSPDCGTDFIKPLWWLFCSERSRKCHTDKVPATATGNPSGGASNNANHSNYGVRACGGKPLRCRFLSPATEQVIHALNVRSCCSSKVEQADCLQMKASNRISLLRGRGLQGRPLLSSGVRECFPSASLLAPEAVHGVASSSRPADYCAAESHMPLTSAIQRLHR